MQIRLRPELADQEQEAWLAANRAAIQTKIAEGYASAQRGELVGSDELRSRLQELKSRKV